MNPLNWQGPEFLMLYAMIAATLPSDGFAANDGENGAACE